QQRLCLESRAVTSRTRRVGTITRQEYAHVHLVGFGFEPGEEPLHAVPDALGPLAFALDHPFAPFGAELAPGRIQRNPALFRELLQVFLALRVRLRLPRLDGPAAQRLALIRYDEAVVDADR